MANSFDCEDAMDAEPPVSRLLWCWPLRYTVAVLACLALVNMHAQHTALSAALACMLNASQLIHDVAPLDVRVVQQAALADGKSDFFEACGDAQRGAMGNGSWSGRSTTPATAVRSLPEDPRWTLSFQRLLLAAFPCGCLLTPLAAGAWTVRSSARKLLGYAQLTMAVCTLLTPVTGSYMQTYAVVVLQGVAGMAAGVTYPCLMAIWFRWSPLGERNLLFSITFAGMPLGVVLSTSTVQVTCYFGQSSSWSGVFFILGLLGVAWFVLWMVLVSSSPLKNKRISEAELKMIPTDDFQGHQRARIDIYGILFFCCAAAAQFGVPWRHILSSPAVWAMISVHSTTDWVLHLLIFSLPVYLHDAFQLNLHTFLSGYFSTAPFAAFLLVALTCGLLSDCLTSLCSIATVRRLFTLVGAVVSSLGLVLITSLGCARWTLLVLSPALVAAGLGLLYLGCMLAPLDMSPRLASLLLGVSLSVAQGVKLVGCFSTNLFTSEGGDFEWSIVLYVSAALVLLASVVFTLFGAGPRDLDSISTAFPPPTHAGSQSNETSLFIGQRAEFRVGSSNSSTPAAERLSVETGAREERNEFTHVRGSTSCDGIKLRLNNAAGYRDADRLGISRDSVARDTVMRDAMIQDSGVRNSGARNSTVRDSGLNDPTVRKPNRVGSRDLLGKVAEKSDDCVLRRQEMEGDEGTRNVAAWHNQSGGHQGQGFCTDPVVLQGRSSMHDVRHGLVNTRASYHDDMRCVGNERRAGNEEATSDSMRRDKSRHKVSIV